MFEWAPEELAHVGQMIREGKYEESLKILEDFEEIKKDNPQDLILSYQFKGFIFLFQGLVEKTFEQIEKIYEASLRFSKPLLTVDTYLFRANVLILNYNFDKGIESIKQGEDLLNSLTDISKNDKNRREVILFQLKGMSLDPSLSPTGNIDLALENYKKSLALAETFNDKDRIITNLLRIGWIIGMFQGDLNFGLEYVERALVLAKSIKFKLYIIWSLNSKAAMYHNRGEISRSFLFYEESLAIAKEIDQQFFVATILNNMADTYRMKGELDNAIECSKKSIEVLLKVGNLRNVANSHDFLIQSLIEKGDLEQAQEYITRLDKLKNQLNNKDVDDIYRYNQALLLKESSRISNRGKAEEIFKEIIKDKTAHWEANLRSLLSLCELLLLELQMTGNSEVLEEVESYIDQLVEIAEKSHSYWIWGETYLLRAKLALILLDMKEARRLLSQGQKIAEKFGITKLARKISNEHDVLLKQLDRWEYLKKHQISKKNI
jgi:tetratricopeptide (TPR) repeat protein